MNKLKTTDNGGFKFRLDDLRWINNGLEEALKALISTSGLDLNNTIIISGVEKTISGPNIIYSEGFIWIDGEICYYPGQTLPSLGGVTHYFDINVSYDPAGNKQFQNGDFHDTYEVRQGIILSNVSVPSGKTAYDEAERIHDSFKVFYTYTDTEFSSGDYPLEVMKDQSGFIHIRGNMMFNDVGVGLIAHHFATLPERYRPTQNRAYSVSYVYDLMTGEVRTSIISILTDGKIYLTAHHGYSTQTLDLSQIPPFK